MKLSGYGVSLGLLLIASTWVSAESYHTFSGSPIILAENSRSTLSREEAANIAQQQTGGRVLAVERTNRDGQPAYRVKVLSRQGEVRVIYVNAATGTIQ